MSTQDSDRPVGWSGKTYLSIDDLAVIQLPEVPNSTNWLEGKVRTGKTEIRDDQGPQDRFRSG